MRRLLGWPPQRLRALAARYTNHAAPYLRAATVLKKLAAAR